MKFSIFLFMVVVHISLWAAILVILEPGASDKTVQECGI